MLSIYFVYVRRVPFMILYFCLLYVCLRLYLLGFPQIRCFLGNSNVRCSFANAFKPTAHAALIAGRGDISNPLFYMVQTPLFFKNFFSEILKIHFFCHFLKEKECECFFILSVLLYACVYVCVCVISEVFLLLGYLYI